MPLDSAMTSIRDAIVTALKSLLRGKSFLRALLAFWTASPVTTAVPVDPQHVGTKANADPAADFLAEAEHLLLGYIDAGGLKQLARGLKTQFRERLWSNPVCMLPSYNSQLPTGDEVGQFLALDVGGSTLRVALVHLRGRGAPGSENNIIRMDTFKIDNDVRGLRGREFFDWMAERIHRTVAKDSARGHRPEHPLLMGLAWSFPITQTSSKGGKLSVMGKGFLANDGLMGEDLGEIIETACKKQGLYVELSAIVNDSSAALLSEAYTTPSTRFSLILGTGSNIAAYLPVTTIDRPKFGDRPDSWHEKASHVIVNTEASMFGQGILPLTKWDKVLKAAHDRPDFQPIEQLVSGYYLGEICRLALLDAIQSTGVFGGVVPPSLRTPYSLDTETLSVIEADTSPTLTTALQTFTARHPSPGGGGVPPPTPADLSFLRTLASHITRRSASVVAAAIFALWELKAEAEAELLATLSLSSPFLAETEAELRMVARRPGGGKTTVAFNGSVVEQYPGYSERLQEYVDGLLAEGGGEDGEDIGGRGSIELVAARESSLRGAAVALACLA
ncbi:actin-like ATPase domain-containing protein [Parathielavia hyrcaniae]|uniref:Phosphotransferase n=1 Tax=Parathielavia hyrcaniae TaxID=113614 RepID=A0AAN6Q492_9PEZI|nr:actin-like ATPase domain-containing protein [Parathielavia hyrcaniae]